MICRRRAKGFLNFIGTDLGVEGALRRDENNHVFDFDQYLQVRWDPDRALAAHAGVRNSVVSVGSHDLLSVSGDPDSACVCGTDRGRYHFRAAPMLHLYGLWQGLETPTLQRYRVRSTDGSIPGLNLGLKPARSDNFELGSRAGDSRWRANLAAFYVKTHDDWGTG